METEIFQPYVDEPDSIDLETEVKISDPEICDLPEVEPDEFDEIYGWFLS